MDFPSKEERDDFILQWQYLPLRVIQDKYGWVDSAAAPLLDYDDLVQAGIAALIVAVDRFDPDRGAGFKTFAYLVISTALARYTNQHLAHLTVRSLKRALEGQGTKHDAYRAVHRVFHCVEAPEVVGPGPDVSDSVIANIEHREQMEIVREALSDSEYQLLLEYYRVQSMRKVAENYDVTYQMICKRLQAIREKCRDALRESFPGEFQGASP